MLEEQHDGAVHGGEGGRVGGWRCDSQPMMLHDFCAMLEHSPLKFDPPLVIKAG